MLFVLNMDNVPSVAKVIRIHLNGREGLIHRRPWRPVESAATARRHGPLAREKRYATLFDSSPPRVPGVPQPIALAALSRKPQWNFKKTAARQTEPDERDAMSQLAVKVQALGDAPFKVQVTGPFTHADQG
jgi:hypothetical protein